MKNNETKSKSRIMQDLRGKKIKLEKCEKNKQRGNGEIDNIILASIVYLQHV